MRGEQARSAAARRRRWALAIVALAVAGVVAGVAALPRAQLRYYLWRLEHAYQALPGPRRAASPEFTTVPHYQNKLIGLGETALEPLLDCRHKHDYLWYWITTTAVVALRSPLSEEAMLVDTQSKDVRVVRQALGVLAALPELHCQEHLIPLLEHRSAGVRMATLRLTSRHRVRAAYPMACELLRSDPHVMVRALASQAVARLGGRRSIPLLIEALDDPGVTSYGRHISVREAARFWLTVMPGQFLGEKEEWERWWREAASQDDLPAPAGVTATTGPSP